MKILYALWNYPQYSETYIAAEIAFALRNGIQIEVWSKVCRHPQIIPPCKVHRGTLLEAVEAMRPDVIHVHYLIFSHQIAGEFPEKIPVVVRGHSFDWNLQYFDMVAKEKKVKKILLFPHFAAQTKGHKKVVSVPVAYDSTLHKPNFDKDRKHVVRLAAGLPTKGLDKFLSVAALCPDHKFTLVLATSGGADGFPRSFQSKDCPSNVEVQSDISEREAIDLNKKAGIYLDTNDPKGHAFGMPISIMEAMATGSLVLVEDYPDAVPYVGSGGLLYKDVADAARLIKEPRDDRNWQDLSKAAVMRANAFKDEQVLPALIKTWQDLS